MFGWARTLYDLTALRNEARVSPACLYRLGIELRRLNKLGGRLGSRAVGYVTDGTGVEVLSELGRRRGGGTLLGLTSVEQPGQGGALHLLALLRGARRRQRLLRGALVARAGFFLRLAKVWEAAARREVSRRAPADETENDAPAWWRIFLEEAVGSLSLGFAGADESTFDASVVEEMLRLDGAPADLAVRTLLLGDPNDKERGELATLIRGLAGSRAAIERHPETVRQALARSQTAPAKVAALQILRDESVDVALFAEDIVDLAVSSARTVREAAARHLPLLGASVRPLFEKKAAAGTPGERRYAVRRLWRLCGDEAESFLRRRLREESSSRVRQTLQEILAGDDLTDTAIDAVESGYDPRDLEPWDSEPLAPVDVDVPLPEAVRECLRRMYADWERELSAVGKRYKERGEPFSYHSLRFTQTDADQTFEELLSYRFRGQPPRFQISLLRPVDVDFLGSVESFLARPELQLVHFVRFVLILGEIRYDKRTPAAPFHVFGPQLDRLARVYRRSHSPAFGLRELAAVFSALGLDPAIIGWGRLAARRFDSRFAWEDEAVWPYFAEHVEILEEALELRSPTVELSLLKPTLRRNALAVLAQAPTPPSSLVGYLWEVALGTSKAERALAQEALLRAPRRDARIAAALRNSRQEARVAAAEWLARLGVRSAVPELAAALARDKREVAKAAFLSALDQLGERVERYLGRRELLAEAEQGLAEGVPAQLDWLDFANLPRVHWADSGEAVAEEILRWVIVRGLKLKSPEPGPLLRRHVALFREDECRAYGQYVLEAWIARDEVASAVREAGILAVPGACCGAAGVAAVQRYVERWRGRRTAQTKSLVHMLVWIDHPAAVRLLQGIARRFPAASVRQEAQSSIEILAESHGWTSEELADRAVPNAGFEDDEEGGPPRLVLDYGCRRFVAALDEELHIVLATPEGQPIRSLPAASTADDAPRVSRARRRLAAARQELKAIVREQGERLYEAMCTGRGWPFAEWQRYLAGHPVLGRLCPRLVWAAWEEDGGGPRLAVTFRLRADATLTSVDGEEVAPAAAATVRLAHEAHTGPDLAAAWLRHLDEKGIRPLFRQFGKTCFTLPEVRCDELMLADFAGHMLDAFQLRGEATRRGYHRGGTGDGSYFYTYRKSFVTAGLDAVIEFSGNLLPEENIPVALKTLYFEPVKEQEEAPGPGGRVPLGKVPPVLLAEVCCDLATLSKLGSGFDPEWEQKVGW